MRILRLVAENVKRLQAVEITPDDSPVVVVSGDNENGKSSCLDAIEMALGGKSAIPKEPVRRGAKAARIVVDLGDIVVTRNITKDGGGSLTVTNRDGAKYPSPQAMLDGLYSRLTFDPLEFARLSGSKEGRDRQAQILRDLARLDVSDLETERQQVYEERTLVNRDLTRTKAAVAQMPVHEDVGPDLFATDEIEQEIEEADIALDEIAGKRRHLEDLGRKYRDASMRCDAAGSAVEDARAALEAAEIESELAAAAEREAQAEYQRAEAVPIPEPPDRKVLRARLAEVVAANAQIEANTRRAAVAEEVRAHQIKAGQLTDRLEQIDAEKAERLAAAVFPVDGLGLDDAGVTWQGLPFDQASTAIRTRVSVAIGFALHPQLRVLLVRNGNDLDAKNLALIAEAAAEAGGQLWLERIAGGNGLQTIVIENGSVASAQTAEAKR